MAEIRMTIPDEDLAMIDEVAKPSRTASMLEAAMEAVARIRRVRTDAEIQRCLAETPEEDGALSTEFAGVAADGLKFERHEL